MAPTPPLAIGLVSLFLPSSRTKTPPLRTLPAGDILRIDGGSGVTRRERKPPQALRGIASRR